MPRVARIVVPGLPHHITQRGNNRQEVFGTADDYGVYLSMLRRECARFGVSLLGWCLMPNHVHLVGIPESATSLAKAIGRTNWLYARYFNNAHKRSGHLWQNRYYSCPVALDHLKAVLRYVDLNPVRGSLCARPMDWRWSSATAHCTQQDTDGLLNLKRWAEIRGDDDWRESVSAPQASEVIALIRTQTTHGRPIASAQEMRRMEKQLGVVVIPLPVGRPR